MQNIYKLFFVISFIGVIMALSACGKMAAPIPYESNYPHSYPQQ